MQHVKAQLTYLLRQHEGHDKVKNCLLRRVQPYIPMACSIQRVSDTPRSTIAMSFYSDENLVQNTADTWTISERWNTTGHHRRLHREQLVYRRRNNETREAARQTHYEKPWKLPVETEEQAEQMERTFFCLRTAYVGWLIHFTSCQHYNGHTLYSFTWLPRAIPWLVTESVTEVSCRQFLYLSYMWVIRMYIHCGSMGRVFLPTAFKILW